MLTTELRDRWATVLREMSTISEAPAIRYDGDRVKGGGAKSAPPPGVRFNRRDMRDLSLASYWKQRFDVGRGDERKLTVFLYLAELDLQKARVRSTVRPPHETTQERSERVLRQYEGLTALEAALAEDCQENWIRRVRLNAGVSGEDGWPIGS